jgi:hypothetical protein
MVRKSRGSFLKTAFSFFPDAEVPADVAVPLDAKSVHGNKFAYWRFCCLGVLSTIWFAYLVMVVYSSFQSISRYKSVVTYLPIAAQANASNFPKALRVCDGALALSCVVQLIFIWLAHRTWRNYNRSKKYLQRAWLLMYITPFVVMLVFPYRFAVDWDAASVSVCESTVTGMESSGAIQTFLLVDDDSIKAKISPELMKREPSPAIYCNTYGTTWTAVLTTDLSVLQCNFEWPPSDFCCEVRDLDEIDCTVAQASTDAVDSTNVALYRYLENLQATTAAAVTSLDNSK